MPQHARLGEPDPPLSTVSGTDAEDMAAHYRAQGFRVQIITMQPDSSAPATADLVPDRIRLLATGSGTVLRASRG